MPQAIDRLLAMPSTSPTLPSSSMDRPPEGATIPSLLARLLHHILRASKGGTMPGRPTAGAKALLVLGFLAAPAMAQALTYEYLFVPDQVRTDRQLYLNLVVQDSGIG